MLRNISAFLMVVAGVATAGRAHEVRGTVIDAATGEPIAGASVYGTDDTSVVTDERGAFVLPGDAPSVTVITGDHDPAVADVREGVVLVRLVARVTSESGESGEVIEVADTKEIETPGALRVDRGKLRVLPGARGDVLSSVKNLPGIANNGSLTPLSSGLIIRGASSESSRILVDGFEIPVLYHFLGVQSVLPTEMLAGLEYLPGAFGTSYGRATGGIVAASSRDEMPKQAGGFAELSFINVSGLVEGPLGKRASYALAARRSVIDAILPGVLPSDGGLSFTAYPRYYDYQGKVTFQPDERWTLSAFAFGSDDRVVLFSDGDNAMDPAASGNFANATSFTRAIGAARYHRPGLGIELAASGYTDSNHFTVGSDRFLLLDRDGVGTRSEVTWDPSKLVRVVAGAESDVTRTGYDIKFTRPPREGDPRGPNFTQDALLVTTGSNTFRDVAAWSQATLYPTPGLELTGGARVDAYLRNDRAVVQPRGQLVWRPANGSTLRAASGLYTRPPEHLDQGLQPDLGPERVVQSSVGGERRLTDAITAKATVFYNHMTDLLVLPADRRDVASLGGYENIGTGDARGVELLLEVRTDQLFGWIAYTGARATRRDQPGMAERRFDYDQAHNLIALGSWQLTPHWRVGARFQLTTGKPYTPVVGATYQADVDLYLPRYGAPNSQRVDVQHQLDLRVDRMWSFARWKLAAYLDVSNVYVNAAAIEYQYNFDYTRRTAITTLPIIPSFGLRGEL